MEIEIKNKRYGCLSLVMWFLLVFFAGIVLIGLGSCKSVQYIPMEKIKHDSIYISKTDTLKVTHTIKEKEYVTVKDSSSVVLDEQGKVLKQEIWHNKTIIRQMSDSLEYYKAKCDSLYAEKQKTIEVPVEIEKPLTTWQKRYISLGKVSLGVYVGLLIAFIAWIVYYIKRKKRLP